MPILPVLDLMNGLVVRGIAGQRENYRPIVSQLCASADPGAVATALRERFGFTELYLADLDAIQHRSPQWEVWQALVADGFRLWLDAGIQNAKDNSLDVMLRLDASIIAGLESVDGPAELREILNRVGDERLVFSVDLKEGKPLGNIEEWPGDAWRIAELAISMGARRMIVLDLARVGVGEGIGTEELCVRLKQTFPELQLTAGGGVRGIDDVRRLTALGVDHVLVASALHDGRIRPEDFMR